MTNKIFIGIILASISFDCVGQVPISEQQRQAYLNAGWFYSKKDSTYVEYQVFDTLISPNKKFNILIRSVGLSDNVIKSQYWLIRTEKKDTTELMSIHRHDCNPPNFFWTSNGYLIYEHTDELGPKSKILLRNLTTNKIDFSTPGSIPIGTEWSHNFYDKDNDILIFFKLGTKETEYKNDLMALDIRNKRVNKLMTFKITFDFASYPIVSLNSQTRKLKVKYWGIETGEIMENELDY